MGPSLGGTCKPRQGLFSARVCSVSQDPYRGQWYFMLVLSKRAVPVGVCRGRGATAAVPPSRFRWRTGARPGGRVAMMSGGPHGRAGAPVQSVRLSDAPRSAPQAAKRAADASPRRDTRHGEPRRERSLRPPLLKTVSPNSPSKRVALQQTLLVAPENGLVDRAEGRDINSGISPSSRPKPLL